MKKLTILLFLALFCVPSISSANMLDIESDGTNVYRAGTLPEFSLELGYAPQESSQMARLRVGITTVKEPLFATAGVVAEIGTKQRPVFGVQMEAMHLHLGLWGELGVGLNTRKHVSAHVSAGWSILGVEYQMNNLDVHGGSRVWLGKVKVPVSLLMYALGMFE